MPAVGAEKICESVDPRIRPQVKTLYRQVKLLEAKLKESAAAVKDEAIVIPYDNGGGQTGIRENPIFPAYVKVLAAYEKALSELREYIGEEKAAEVSQLDTLRAKLRIAK